jgi:transcriptional regulator with XRE-family HTH domain
MDQKNLQLGFQNFLKKFGTTLKELRTKKNMSQVELSTSSKIDYRNYQNIEAGKNNFKIETAYRISNLLGTELIQLLHTQTAPPPSPLEDFFGHYGIGTMILDSTGIIRFLDPRVKSWLPPEFMDCEGNTFEKVVDHQCIETLQAEFKLRKSTLRGMLSIRLPSLDRKSSRLFDVYVTPILDRIGTHAFSLCLISQTEAPSCTLCENPCGQFKKKTDWIRGQKALSDVRSTH